MVIDDIFSLAQSFNSREAAYFSSYLSKSKLKEHAFYLWLFKRLRLKTDNNEQQLLNELTDKNLLKNFSKHKNKLAEYMLESLVSFHAYASITSRIHRLCEIALLLYDKRFYVQSMHTLKEAKAEATKYEKHFLLLEISETERKLLKETTSTGLTKKLNINSEDKTRLFEKIQNEDSFSAINDKVFLLYRELSIVKDNNKQAELEQLMRHPLLKDISKALSFDSRLKYHYIYALYNRLSANYKQALHHREEVIKLWDRHSHMTKEMAIRYREDLSNLLSARHLTKNYHGFEELIKKIENQKTSGSPEEDASVFREVYYLRLLYLLNNNKMEQALELIPVIEKCLDQHQQYIGLARLLNFWHNIAVTFFINGKYKEALKRVKKILDIERTSTVRNDLRQFAQLFELVLYFELNEIRLLEYNLRNTRDRLKNNDRLYEFESTVLTYLKRLSTIVEQTGNARKTWKEFLQSLNQLSQKPGMENLLGLEEISIWVRTKLR